MFLFLSLVSIRPDLINQTIITEDNLDTSNSDENIMSNIDQSNENISLQSIE